MARPHPGAKTVGPLATRVVRLIGAFHEVASLSRAFRRRLGPSRRARARLGSNPRNRERRGIQAARGLVKRPHAQEPTARRRGTVGRLGALPEDRTIRRPPRGRRPKDAAHRAPVPPGRRPQLGRFRASDRQRLGTLLATVRIGRTGCTSPKPHDTGLCNTRSRAGPRRACAGQTTRAPIGEIRAHTPRFSGVVPSGFRVGLGAESAGWA